MGFPKRGQVWLVSLDPVVGHEIAKTRPAVVVSNGRNNQFSSTVSLLPITSSTGPIYPFEVMLEKGEAKLARDSKVKSDQVRTVDKKRLIKPIGTLSVTRMREVERALLIHLDMYL